MAVRCRESKASGGPASGVSSDGMGGSNLGEPVRKAGLQPTLSAVAEKGERRPTGSRAAGLSGIAVGLVRQPMVHETCALADGG